MPWVSLPVHAGHNDDDVAIEPIEDPVWEPHQKNPPSISMDYRVQGGLCGNALRAA